MSSEQTNEVEQGQFESKLLPILDEGVQMTKLIAFRELQRVLAERYPEWDGREINLLAGALINELFLSPNHDDLFLNFLKQHRPLIDREIARLGETLQKLKPLLTDAIRIQFLTDSQRGSENQALLERARTLQVLDTDREVPMPARFIHLVRLVGQAQGLLIP